MHEKPNSSCVKLGMDLFEISGNHYLIISRLLLQVSSYTVTQINNIQSHHHRNTADPEHVLTYLVIYSLTTDLSFFVS